MYSRLFINNIDYDKSAIPLLTEQSDIINGFYDGRKKMKMVCPPFKGENKGHYTAGVISKGMLYVSGQLSIDPDTREVCSGDIKDHTRLALDNVDRVLKEAGVSRNDVVMCRVYTPDVNYWGPINEVYAEFFGDHKPARVIVSTTTLHFGCLVEIEAVAEMPEA